MTRSAVGSLAVIATSAIFIASSSAALPAQAPEAAVIPGSLKDTRIPEPANIRRFVKSKKAAAILGKAFFWEMRTGSDGIAACATCHFHAGTDARTINTLNPGIDGVWDATRSGGGGPNYDLVAEDWPFHELADPLDRNSAVLFDTNDVIGAQGVHKSDFIQTFPHAIVDLCQPIFDLVNNVGGINTRQATGRQAPTTINAVFNHRQFWDGRANAEFNGADPFGRRSPDAWVWEATATGVERRRMRLKDSSLASQAVGPPLSPVEMSCRARDFLDIARKMLENRPLRGQEVHSQDSILGPVRHWSGLGIRKKYRVWIERAFQPEWWDYAGDVNGFTLMEANFSMFWGLALQVYEATLVSDDARFDQMIEGRALFTPDEQAGMALFFGKAKCHACHGGAEFTKATVSHILGRRNDPADDEFIEGMLMGDLQFAVYDNGFYNIGARPTFEDIGLGGNDPWGNPLSFTRQAKTGNHVDNFDFNIFRFEVPAEVRPDTRDAVDGAFKTPTLRNIWLTGPYMHHGGLLTLEDVVEFYNRGSDVRGPIGNDTSGFNNPDWGNNLSNLDPDIEVLGLTDVEQAQLVAFLKTLTDERVVYQSAPFDHPQLFIANGHPGGTDSVPPSAIPIFAADDIREIPASGRNGHHSPLLPFLEQRLIDVPESELGPQLQTVVGEVPTGTRGG